MSVLRFVTVHTNPLAVVHVPLCCVCVKLPHDAQLTAAERVVSTHTLSALLDCQETVRVAAKLACPWPGRKRRIRQAR